VPEKETATSRYTQRRDAAADISSTGRRHETRRASAGRVNAGLNWDIHSLIHIHVDVDGMARTDGRPSRPPQRNHVAHQLVKGVFRCKKKWNFDTVLFLFVFDN
jgi:hypothetical protein